MKDSFPARVLRTIRKQRLILPGDRVAVAVSGGADSVALLLLLVELRAEIGVVLSVVHVNHKLRGAESDEDEKFVADLASSEKLEFHTRVAPVRPDQTGIEAAARELRYQAFHDIACTTGFSKIVTAHTLDDQAETVLLRIMRGAGVRGLAGILPRLQIGETKRVEVVRPLLAARRYELEQYLRERGQTWREDSSNRSRDFLRNRVRQRLVPLLKEEFGESAVENLADLAEIARGEEEHWSISHPELRQTGSSLPLGFFRDLPIAVQRRMIRHWLNSVTNVTLPFRAVERVLELAQEDAGAQLELPAVNYILRRGPKELRLEESNPSQGVNYEYRLSVPGSAEIRELKTRFEARLVNTRNVAKGSVALLDPARLPKELSVRNWHAGDRFWPAHSKREKKVKELLADRHISGPERQLWPVITAEGIGVIWVRGLPAHWSFAAAPDSLEALEIIESVVHA